MIKKMLVAVSATAMLVMAAGTASAGVFDPANSFMQLKIGSVPSLTLQALGTPASVTLTDPGGNTHQIDESASNGIEPGSYLPVGDAGFLYATTRGSDGRRRIGALRRTDLGWDFAGADIVRDDTLDGRDIQSPVAYTTDDGVHHLLDDDATVRFDHDHDDHARRVHR